ncbi:MAG: GWxTD domain-containing protein [Gemmatimonadetes bacterium]|nr:GWxTD domain-containing protein [Gemmatimonadota bacterium]
MVYGAMGLIAETGPIPFVGSVHLFAGPTPDSLIAVVALSLRNHGLTFRRDADAFVAEYHVELIFRRGTEIAQQVVRDERVRVSTLRETQRLDESVIYQQFVRLAAGQYVLTISIRDRNGPNASHRQEPLTVSPVSSPGVATPLAVYESRSRTALSVAPDLVANPRSTVQYGIDSLHFYVESYGVPAGTVLVVSAFDASGRVAWMDTSRIEVAGPVRGAAFTVPPSQLSIGRYELRVAVAAAGVTVTAPFLVSFSDRWAVSSLEEIVSLLRHFTSPDTLRALLEAPPSERGAAWLRFWRSTDPAPATAENEALDQYFVRLQVANDRFRDEGIPGWLTERGEVFITLGEPDEVLDRRADLQGRSRVLFWVYREHRLTVAFVDDAGTGRFRLDARSRSEYLRVRQRIRRDT